jgi:hypothetical protein
MPTGKALAALLATAVALASAGCRDSQAERSRTSVLGNSTVERAPAAPTLTDASGQPIPTPPAPAGAQPQMARTGDDSALAVWLEETHVVAASWTRAGGWTAAQPLERIYGDASAPQVVSNGQGIAMALWRHRVGNIHSLRFSRFDAATGWAPPDVLPGAFPRPAAAGSPPAQHAPRLRMDSRGNVFAQWPSGFRANEMQVARYSAAQGWSQAASEPEPPASSASPARPAPSSAR